MRGCGMGTLATEDSELAADSVRARIQESDPGGKGGIADRYARIASGRSGPACSEVCRDMRMSHLLAPTIGSSNKTSLPPMLPSADVGHSHLSASINSSAPARGTSGEQMSSVSHPRSLVAVAKLAERDRGTTIASETILNGGVEDLCAGLGLGGAEDGLGNM
jgi:hypothetical protein